MLAPNPNGPLLRLIEQRLKALEQQDHRFRIFIIETPEAEDELRAEINARRIRGHVIPIKFVTPYWVETEEEETELKAKLAHDIERGFASVRRIESPGRATLDLNHAHLQARNTKAKHPYELPPTKDDPKPVAIAAGEPEQPAPLSENVVRLPQQDHAKARTKHWSED